MYCGDDGEAQVPSVDRFVSMHAHLCVCVCVVCK